jgi:hypothetical protein
MVKATKKGTQLLVESIDPCMKQAWLWKKRSKIQEFIIDKQLDYFKQRQVIK